MYGEKGIGLASVSQSSSSEGVMIYRDHEYDLISVYNNTSGVDQDAMATILLYLRARDMYFQSRPRKKCTRSTNPCFNSWLIRKVASFTI